MKGLTTFVLAASLLSAPLLVQAGEAPKPLRAVAQIQGLTPLPDATLAQIRGQGWADVLAAALAACGGGCTANVQQVSQFNSNPNGSNVSMISQSQ
jgi:hypothetical protein